MGVFDALNHLFNFMLPAFAVALLTTLMAQWIWRKQPPARNTPLGAKIAINFIASFAVLVLGLALLGRDGEMLTYGAMVIVVATSQWWQMRR